VAGGLERRVNPDLLDGGLRPLLAREAVAVAVALRGVNQAEALVADLVDAAEELVRARAMDDAEDLPPGDLLDARDLERRPAGRDARPVDRVAELLPDGELRRARVEGRVLLGAGREAPVRVLARDRRAGLRPGGARGGGDGGRLDGRGAPFPFWFPSPSGGG
jgi:hypothetical protein